ncbi:MAG: hypothetical protein ACYC8T_02350 [Myxococcaceae bacterium]
MPAPAPPRSRLPALVGVVFLAASAFVVWQLTVDPAPELPPAPVSAPPSPATFALAPAPTPALARALPPAPVAVTTAPLPPEPVPSTAPPSPEVMRRANEQAAAALDREHPRFLSQCWKPTPLPGMAPSARFTFQIVVDAEGKELARGISEDREEHRAGVGECLRNLPPEPLHIDPPGHTVTLDVPVVLP